MRPLLSALAGFALFTGAVLPAPPPGASGIVGEYITAAIAM
jgi:hypothetical protein